MAMAHNGLAKLAEELGELQQVVGKKLAYPNSRVHPDGKDLDICLENEIADVTAAIGFVLSKHGLSLGTINARVSAKLALYVECDRQP